MLAIKHNFVVERNVIMAHRGPTYSPSYPLLKEDRDAQRRLHTLEERQKKLEEPQEQNSKQRRARWADQPRKMILIKKDGAEEETRPVLVDEISHVCATCGAVTEADFVSKDGAKPFCSFKCKLKGERPQMLLGMRRQGQPMQATHMKK